MKNAIHSVHDKFFKSSLKLKKVAIDLLKVHLPQATLKAIDLNTLELTEKSFILPQLREIHSDIIYKACIQQWSVLRIRT